MQSHVAVDTPGIDAWDWRWARAAHNRGARLGDRGVWRREGRAVVAAPTGRAPRRGNLYASAAKWLERLHPNNGITKAVQFIKRWHGRVVGKGDLRDAAGRGRHPKLDDRNPEHKKILERCLQEIDKGYIDEEGVDRLFAGMQHAVDVNPFLKEVLTRFAYTLEGLLQRLMDYDPNLRLRTCVVNPAFSDARKAERVGICQKHLYLWEKTLTIFIVSFSLTATPCTASPRAVMCCAGGGTIPALPMRTGA